MNSLAENKETVRRYYEEALNEGRIDLLDDLIANDVVNHDPLSDETLTPAEARGFEGFRSHVELFHEGFRDGSVTIDDIIAEGDTVAARFTVEGIHDGRLGGIEPTGNRVSLTSMVFYRVEDGKIVERWLESDNLEMLGQLEAIELPTP